MQLRRLYHTGYFTALHPNTLMQIVLILMVLTIVITNGSKTEYIVNRRNYSKISLKRRPFGPKIVFAL